MPPTLQLMRERIGVLETLTPTAWLSIEDLLLAMLKYLRVYRTYAHITVSYGIVESNIYRRIKWVKDTLIREGTFFCQGRNHAGGGHWISGACSDTRQSSPA